MLLSSLDNRAEFVGHVMNWRYRSEYLNSPEGQSARYRRRWFRRLLFDITDVEPRSKQAMHDKDKDEFQRQVLALMNEQGRRTFRGPLALCMSLNTTDKNPGHVQTIAKNLLDLLGKPRRSLDILR